MYNTTVRACGNTLLHYSCVLDATATASRCICSCVLNTTLALYTVLHDFRTCTVGETTNKLKMHMPAGIRLSYHCLAALACSTVHVNAHRPLTTSASCGADWGSSAKAVAVPDPTISWYVSAHSRQLVYKRSESCTCRFHVCLCRCMITAAALPMPAHLDRAPAPHQHLHADDALLGSLASGLGITQQVVQTLPRLHQPCRVDGVLKP